MQPKNLSNLSPEELQKNAEANQEFEKITAHQYYETGMKALHKANEIKMGLLEIMANHIMEKNRLGQISAMLITSGLISGMIQLLCLIVLLNSVPVKENLRQMMMVLAGAVAATMIILVILLIKSRKER